ncbi:hypothetical protein B0O80DRAFT_532293 [Mortierella sp. GBAus27b]|nr:hypothetical protein B0O80DRAFT_532293 [Mortierella sp. GBAus27b]
MTRREATGLPTGILPPKSERRLLNYQRTRMHPDTTGTRVQIPLFHTMSTHTARRTRYHLIPRCWISMVDKAANSVLRKRMVASRYAVDKAQAVKRSSVRLLRPSAFKFGPGSFDTVKDRVTLYSGEKILEASKLLRSQQATEYGDISDSGGKVDLTFMYEDVELSNLEFMHNLEMQRSGIYVQPPRISTETQVYDREVSSLSHRRINQIRSTLAFLKSAPVGGRGPWPYGFKITVLEFLFWNLIHRGRCRNQGHARPYGKPAKLEGTGGYVIDQRKARSRVL